MPSITSWTRLEPRSRSNDLGAELQAQVHDPLWMLTRQWQLGELTGQDASSPVSVRLETEVMPIAGVRLGPSESFQGYERRGPLETVIEREPPPDLYYDLALAGEAGVFFLRLLDDYALSRYRDAFIARFPLVQRDSEHLDKDSTAFIGLMANRVPDGRMLVTALDEGIALTTLRELSVEESHIEALLRVASIWSQWWRDLYSCSGTEGSAWQEDRLEYRFGISATNGSREVILEAPEYHGGRLDWLDFLVVGEKSSDMTVEPDVRTLLPTSARFPGMPQDRFWEREDARVHFGGVERDPQDLARGLLLAYALIYSNDWFLAPLELPVGSICRLRGLVVRDACGGETRILPAGQGEEAASDWSLFRLATAGNDGTPFEGLFLAPTLPDGLEGRPIEEVRFMRDEMANVAWAIERTVEGPKGQPIDRGEFSEDRRRAQRVDSSGAAVNASLFYRLVTDVPEHWFSLLPIEDKKSGLRFVRGGKQRVVADRLVDVAPLGHILQTETGSPLSFFAEEIPREGARVKRTWQYVRWVDGSTHVWRGRRKTAGAGEGSSGLLFDIIALGETS